MSTVASTSSSSSGKPDSRRMPAGATSFSLFEVPPQLVVKGVVLEDVLLAEDVTPVGQMRETCPYCGGVPLQLVLRSDHVILPHLFCEQCTRCFEATYPDGRSALMFSRLAIY